MAYAKELRITVSGVDLAEAFGATVMYDFSLGSPEPKTYTVDIPGGNGVIDLTTALTGDVAYGRRKHTFNLAFGLDDFEGTWSRLASFLHGRAHDYVLSIDPEYTYHGRFSVGTAEYKGRGASGAAVVALTVDADPYKLKERCVYRLNATGGKLFRLESGRRPVHPTVECESVCWVTFGGETVAVPAGTHVLRDVVFREGVNEIYVNSRRIWAETWADVGEGGADEAAWADAAALTWDGIQRLGLADAEGVPQSWAEVALDTWAGLGAKTWRDLDYRRTEAAQGSADVYLTYDWEDL